VRPRLYDLGLQVSGSAMMRREVFTTGNRGNELSQREETTSQGRSARNLRNKASRDDPTARSCRTHVQLSLGVCKLFACGAGLRPPNYIQTVLLCLVVV
jgi:hypothetical protein